MASRSFVASAIVLAALCATPVDAQTEAPCLAKEITISNSGFEADNNKISRTGSGYLSLTGASKSNCRISCSTTQTSPADWTCTRDWKEGDQFSVHMPNYHICVLVQNGARAYQGSNSGSGTSFVALHGRVSMTRTFNNLTPNKEYVLSFLAAERHGYGGSEVMTVTANGKVIANQVNPATAFAQYTFKFTASGSGSLDLKFSNVSPHSSESDAHTIYLDNIQIGESFDCGTGAGCYTHQAGILCRCDQAGFLGLDSLNKKATCITVRDLQGTELLKKRIDTLADQFKTSSQTLKGLSEKSVALTKTTDLEAARIDALQDFQDEAQDANATMYAIMMQMRSELDTAQSDVTGLKGGVSSLTDQVQALTKANTDLVAALKAGIVNVPAVEDPSRLDRNVAPEIVSEGGGLDLQLQQGRHATVNGAMLVTAEEVRVLIKQAVADALVAVGTAVHD